MLVQDFLTGSAKRLPAKTALVCDGDRFSYEQLELMSNRLANALRENGVNRGDRVALYYPNSLAAVVAIFATLKAGAVFVPINPTTKREKLLFILNNCGAVAFLTDKKGEAQSCAQRLSLEVASLRCIVLEEATGNQPNPVFLEFRKIQETYSSLPSPRVNSLTDLACLIYTSGSTGDPKGVMCEHGSVVFAAGSITTYLENVEEDIILNVLPLSFDYGLYQLLMAFKVGATLVLENSFAFPSMILRLIQQERVTGFPGVPTIYAMLLNMDLAGYDLTSLRYVTNTAAALAPTHVEAIRKKFDRVKLYSMYGLTETKRTLYLPPDQLAKRPGSVGVAIPGTEVWIEDENGRRLPVGEIGELVVRGPHVMRGYWQSPEETARRFRIGSSGERLCYTGDLFRMDEEGYLYFVGRKDDIIKSRGEKVSPKEVENVLYALKGVREAAVIGVNDPLLGQAVKAFIVTNGVSLSASQVLAHCRARLEDFMVPKSVEFRDELPKTTSGKIKKTELR